MLSSKNLMKNKKKKGFSLLEIVVSLGLIALFIIPMGNMVLGTVKINKASEDKQQASAVLQETVEYIRGMTELPKLGMEAKDIGNGVMIKAEEEYEYETEAKEPKKGIRYSIKGSNNATYGFTVDGEIFGKEVIAEEQLPGGSISDLNTFVDGVIYYSGDEKDELVSVSKTKYTIKYAVEKTKSLTYDINSKKDDEVDINLNEQNVEVKVAEAESFIDRENNSLLIILDNENTDEKFEVELDEGCMDENFTFYLYNKNKKANLSDIEIDCEADGHDHSGLFKTVNESMEDTIVEGINMYSLNIKANKKGKTVDSLILDFIK